VSIAAGPTLVAIDLGAESCRVSLLQWQRDLPGVRIIRRFANAPQDHGPAGLRWDLSHICNELEAGLRACAELAPEGIAGIGVTGWAVDYIRLNHSGQPSAPPYCYRDPRTNAAMKAVNAILPAEKLYALTGVQNQPLNTIYQLFADQRNDVDTSAPWLNIPEYILYWLGAPPVAEYTNATHTALIDPDRRQWSDEIFAALALDRAAAPELVFPGTKLGPVCADLRRLPAFASAQLIAPACHDTASAIAGIPECTDSWAYISSGTWSLVGALRPKSLLSPQAYLQGFTNLGATDGRVLFHRGIAGMWLLRQCLETWQPQRSWTLDELIAEARQLPAPDSLLDLDDPALIPPGDMPTRINAQRARHGLAPLPDGCESAPYYAALVFHSLANRYSVLLREMEHLTGSPTMRIRVVGGGSRNEFLNALTSQTTGLPVERFAVESSTLGNLALQWASLDESAATPESITTKVSMLTRAEFT
jgi:rhamnulokinase